MKKIDKILQRIQNRKAVERQHFESRKRFVEHVDDEFKNFYQRMNLPQVKYIVGAGLKQRTILYDDDLVNLKLILDASEKGLGHVYNTTDRDGVSCLILSEEAVNYFRGNIQFNHETKYHEATHISKLPDEGQKTDITRLKGAGKVLVGGLKRTDSHMLDNLLEGSSLVPELRISENDLVGSRTTIKDTREYLARHLVPVKDQYGAPPNTNFENME